MRIEIYTFLVSLFIRTSVGSALQVIDQGGQCVIWSNDNHGCTGYSAPFGKLKGDDCSELSEVVNGKRKKVTTLDVTACGMENGKSLAWIMVNQTGVVTFFNRNGDKSGCTLNNGLKTGSWCNSSDHDPKTTTSLSSSRIPSATSSPMPDPTTASSTASTCRKATKSKPITTASSSYSPIVATTSSLEPEPLATTPSTSCICFQKK